MSGRRHEGAALLVAGHGAPGVGAFDASAVHTLGQIGEALLATGTPWQIRRLTASTGDRNAADRPTLKRSLIELSADPVRVAIVVLLGEIIEVGGELALVTGAEAHEYPEDATLPLSWIRDRLYGAKAEHLVAIVSACGDGGSPKWLGALGTERGQHVIAVDAPEAGNRLVDALLTGLCGDALDPRTGTVTMASLSAHLALHTRSLQPSTASETVAQPPPLAGLWDVRRSQLAHRAVKRAAGEPEDLTGSVLPGRFRIDRFIARGTFGTVYQARQLAVERDVAIKVLNADIDPSSEDGRLFVHEIRSVGRIDHTNVVRIYQADITHDGRLFFAMEFLDGHDLQDAEHGGKLPRARAVELVRQLLAGLGAAHDAGLVHADIKPANAIVVSRARRAATAGDAAMPALARRKLTVTPAAGVPIDVGAATIRTRPVAAAPPVVALDSDGLETITSTRPSGNGGALETVTSSGGATEPAISSGEPVGTVPRTVSPTTNGNTSPATAPAGNGVPLAGITGRGPDRGAGSRANRLATAELDERVVLVDFGLARLRAPDRPAESAGGTPAYMAPEQLHEGRVDARSDLFSVALLFVWLMTGWRRPNARTLVPSLDIIEDADLRAVLERALDKDPAKRFQSARELADALGGNAPAAVEPPPPILPFRHLAPLTEDDRDRLHGREADLGVITEHALYRRAVIYTAPSGTGKTSMLRAGLLPRLESLGIHAVYIRARADSTAAVIAAISPGAASIAGAITAFHEHRGGKLVLVVDQLEAALSDAAAPPGEDFVHALLGFDHWPRGADVTIVLSVREDYLARLVARTHRVESGIPIIRLPPLAPDGARVAIVAPLTEARLAIDPDLLDVLLADLQRAAAAIAPEMGWGAEPAVFPPHLQLACSVLYEALGPDDATLSLAHYRKLGGFDAIVGEHLDRVIETELDDGRDLIARDLFVALVTAANERAIRSESELVSIVGAKHGAGPVLAVLEILRSRGLLFRVRGDDEPSWELVHDSLVPRVLAWIDRKDLARRRAVELVRYHLRRSTPELPSLLYRRELRELRAHVGAIEELDAEWQKRDTAPGDWTPSRLVSRSRQALRRRSIFFSSVLVAALGIGGAGMYRSHVEEERAREQASLRDRDLGRVTFALEPFDWDPVAQRAIPVDPSTLPLHWELHSPDPDDPEQAGTPYSSEILVRGMPRVEGGALVEHVEARGGPAFLRVTRGNCAPSILPLSRLPGYATRNRAVPVFRIRVPTCNASRADMLELAAGWFVFGGVGDPPSRDVVDDPLSPVEQRIALPRFGIDRTEITNAAFEVFTAMSSITGITHPVYPESPALSRAGEPRKPVTGISWTDVRAYCRFLGKDLPTSRQWTRALRGGERLADGTTNPMPRRNFPWGAGLPDNAAKIVGVGDFGPSDVGAYPLDRSPDGVYDLAGNVYEWTSTSRPGEVGIRVVRGGNWAETDRLTLVEFVAIENPRGLAVQQNFALGGRCATRL